uniref:Uncharacterized protein n=1 Tax=Anguilla anguilla TaxID=7936 RepID=A0A0E9S6C8_ANGAN
MEERCLLKEGHKQKEGC